ASGTLTFSPGETQKTITVQTLEDDEEEVDENFFVDLNDPTGPATIDDPRGIGTILDDESEELQLTISDSEAYEGDPEEFTVQLSGEADGAIRVSYTTLDSTASAAEGDYESTAGTLIFLPGQTQKTIQVPTTEDEIQDPDETFEVVLDILSGDVAFLEDGIGTGTIMERTAAGEAGAAGEEEEGEPCQPICPPTLPAIGATKDDELYEDKNGNGILDPDDTLKYSIEISKLRRSSTGEITYVDPLSPYLELIESSIEIPWGEYETNTEAGRDVLVVNLPPGSESAGSGFPAIIEFRAKFTGVNPENLEEVSGQGVLYSANSPTTVTDDPDTESYHDPTVTDFHNNNMETEEAESQLDLFKTVLEVEREDSEQEIKKANRNDTNRMIAGKTRVKLGILIRVKGKDREEHFPLNVTEPVDRHLTLEDNSVKLNGDTVSYRLNRETGLLHVSISSDSDREEYRITYWVTVDETINNEVGHFGTRTMVGGKGLGTTYSEDPDSDVLRDRTVLHLQNNCDQGNYMDLWKEWLDQLKELPGTLIPVIVRTNHSTGDTTAGSVGEERREEGLTGEEWAGESGAEEGGSYGLSWAIVGDDSTDSSSDSASTPRSGARFVLSGAGYFSFSSSGIRDLMVGGSLEDKAVYVPGSCTAPVFVPSNSEGSSSLSFGEGSRDLPLCREGYVPIIIDSGRLAESAGEGGDVSTGDSIELFAISDEG
ncbi:MAG: Calx-beta domain-containing protein, partial [Candidatus Bipolaricaulota bacterium]